MGLLDSNKVRLQSKGSFVVTSATAETGNWEIDCKGYKTLALLVKSATAATSLTIQKKGEGFTYNTYYPFNVWSLETTPKSYKNNAVTVPQGNGTFLYMDVSDCDSIKVMKTDTSATTTIMATLNQYTFNEVDFLGNIIDTVLLNRVLKVETSGESKLSNLAFAKQNVTLSDTATTTGKTYTDIDCQKFKTIVITFISAAAGAKFQIRKIRNSQVNTYVQDDVNVIDTDNYSYYRQEAGNPNELTLRSTHVNVLVDCDGCTGIRIVKTDSAVTVNSIKYSLSQYTFEPAKEWYQYYPITAGEAATVRLTRKSGMRTLTVKANITSGTSTLNVIDTKHNTKIVDAYVEDINGNVTKTTYKSGVSRAYSAGYYIIHIDISDMDKINFTKSTGSDVATFEFIQSPDDFSSDLKAKIKALTPTHVIVDEVSSNSRLESILNTDNYTISKYSSVNDANHMMLGAVWQNIAVWFTSSALYISNDGLDGDVTKVDFVSSDSNFPGLIANSSIKRIMIVPYHRRFTSGSTVQYSGKYWRLVVFTDKGQIYHNYPDTADGYNGQQFANGEYKFDESVVWDLPDRMNPVKTTSGDDATLIATGKYKYIPCLPDHMYEMHPAINQTNPYGNTGFGAVKTYTDELTNQEVKRARFFVPVRGFDEGDSFNWLSGCIQDAQMSAIGTYIGAYNYMGRVVVFTTNDGREWFAQKEYGAHGEIIAEGENGDVNISSPWGAFAEYGDVATNRINFGTNTMSNSSAFVVKKRSQYAPSDYAKDPEATYDGHTGHRFKYGSAVNISSIVSNTSDGIVVTTATAHGLINGDNIVIEKVGNGVAAWNWLCAEGHDDLQAGNGTLWKIRRLSDTTFRLMLEVQNPNENLSVRHIHSLNYAKEGLVVSCGEEYPNGWIELINKPLHDAFSKCFAGNSYPVYRLNSTRMAVQRTLGTELIDGDNGIEFYFGADTDNVQRDNVTLPEGRYISFKNSSLGVYKAALADIDNYATFDCILAINEPAYFFKIVEGIMIFCGQQGTVALSKDMGNNWTVFRVSDDLYAGSWLMGVTSKKEICIRYYGTGTSNSALIIKCNV